MTMASQTPSPATLALNSVASPPQSQGTGVAAFIGKVWSILENHDYQQLVSWSECGKNVIIHDYPNFSKDVLPRYFKHNNFNSFVRQLNLYGFRKVSHPEHGVLSKVHVQVAEPIEFWHANFRRGHPELLPLVQRRPVNNRTTSEEKGPELSKVLTDIHQMKGKQENIGEMLVAMKQDNVHLKRELELLRERHIRQQRVLNKIIQFLVHMVYKGRLPPTNRKRVDSRYLMLTDSEGVAPPAKRGRVALDPSPQQFSFSDIDDLATLPIDAAPLVESLDSVPPPLPPLLPAAVPTTYTVTSPTSPSQHVTHNNPQYSLEPALDTSSSLLPVTMPSPLTSEPYNVLAAGITSPPVSTLSSSSSTSLIPALPDPSTLGTADVEGDGITSDFSFPDWSNLTGHIDSHQQELDSLPTVLSSQLYLDPSLLNQFISIGEQPVPDYDAIDTARLLETLAGEDDEEMAILREKSPQNALVPITQTSNLLPFLAPHSQEIEKDEPSSSLRELLELKDTLTDT